MAKLVFERQKYGRELLMDATTVEDMVLVDDQLEITFYTISLIKRGSGTIRIDTEHIELHDHTILFFKPGQHTYVADAQFLEGVFLFFEGEFLDIFFNDKAFIYKLAFFHDAIRPPSLLMQPDSFGQVADAALEICAELNQLQNDSEHLLRSLLYYVLIRLNRAYAESYQAFDGLITNPHLLRFKALLEQRIRVDHRVQSYAEALQISRTYLNQLCSKYLGRTSQNAIRERLLLEAKKELIFTPKDITEIAYDLNFPAPPHFVRFFKHMTQQTPQQYRIGFSNW